RTTRAGRLQGAVRGEACLQESARRPDGDLCVRCLSEYLGFVVRYGSPDDVLAMTAARRRRPGRAGPRLLEQSGLKARGEPLRCSEVAGCTDRGIGVRSGHGPEQDAR